MGLFKKIYKNAKKAVTDVAEFVGLKDKNEGGSYVGSLAGGGTTGAGGVAGPMANVDAEAKVRQNEMGKPIDSAIASGAKQLPKLASEVIDAEGDALASLMPKTPEMPEIPQFKEPEAGAKGADTGAYNASESARNEIRRRGRNTIMTKNLGRASVASRTLLGA